MCNNIHITWIFHGDILSNLPMPRAWLTSVYARCHNSLPGYIGTNSFKLCSVDFILKGFLNMHPDQLTRYNHNNLCLHRDVYIGWWAFVEAGLIPLIFQYKLSEFLVAHHSLCSLLPSSTSTVSPELHCWADTLFIIRCQGIIRIFWIIWD